MSPDAARFIKAARVPESVRPQTFGLWDLRRVDVPADQMHWTGFSTITILRHHTMATLHHEAGETVMEDSWRELSRHLPIWMAARGRVLITGLGLGCVVRGLLANPAVEHVDVVELDIQIIRRIGLEFAGNPRVTLWHMNALDIGLGDAKWDFAWHDLWVEGDSLPIIHAELIYNLKHRVKHQGAWAFPKEFGRMMRVPMLGLPRQAQTRRAA